MMQWKKYLVIICMTVLPLCGCDHSKQSEANKKERVIIAKVERPIQPLYYSGSLEPIRMIPILSPVAGNVVHVNFDYGTFVKKRQDLISIDSSQLTQKFKKSITEYLQKKGTFENNLEDFQGTKALYEAGVISRQEYLTVRNQYQTSQISFYQAQFEMEKILRQAGVDISRIEKLTLASKSEILEILKRQFKHIVVRSSAEGIALFPSKSDQADDDAKRIYVGEDVKQGQLLLLIGDMSGLSARIRINEVNIDRIRVGMSVVVSSSAFPGIQLKGSVVAVSSQADPSQDSAGSSMFIARINIPKLLVRYRKVIRVGMTAKIQINVKMRPVVLVPLAAVFQENGTPAVTLIDSKGQRRVVHVMTGATTPTQVGIVSGVKAGDRIVVPVLFNGKQDVHD